MMPPYTLRTVDFLKTDFPQLAGKVLFVEHVPTPSSWSEIFEDAVVATAILDRLLHHASVLAIDGQSYHMRAHRERVAELRKG